MYRNKRNYERYAIAFNGHRSCKVSAFCLQDFRLFYWPIQVFVPDFIRARTGYRYINKRKFNFHQDEKIQRIYRWTTSAAEIFIDVFQCCDNSTDNIFCVFSNCAYSIRGISVNQLALSPFCVWRSVRARPQKENILYAISLQATGGHVGIFLLQ